MFKRRPWQEELRIVDETMKAISGVTDPERLVEVYWQGISQLIPIHDYVALSRRDVPRPEYLITRSSRFTEDLNPWTQRDLLPRLSGGLLGEIAYANKPFIIEDLPDRLKQDDPARFYLEGFQTLIALPQYDNDEGLNVTAMLFPKGHEIDPGMIPVLHWQSGLFGRGTQNLVLKNQLADALALLDRELKIVGDIQRSLLPDKLPEIPGFEIAAFYQTSAQAGGDYYDFFPLPHGGWGIFIADVSGHGPPAAVLMAITHAIAHSQPGTHRPPAALLEYLNNQLTLAYTRGRTFVTAFYAVLDPASRTLTYARAGHNAPRLSRGSEVLVLDGEGGLPLGIMDGQEYRQCSITLQQGDRLLFYTDGITEAADRRQSKEPAPMFGVEGLDRLLLTGDAGSARGGIERIRKAVAEFTGDAAPVDDQTLITLRAL